MGSQGSSSQAEQQVNRWHPFIELPAPGRASAYGRTFIFMVPCHRVESFPVRFLWPAIVDNVHRRWTGCCRHFLHYKVFTTGVQVQKFSLVGRFVRCSNPVAGRDTVRRNKKSGRPFWPAAVSQDIAGWSRDVDSDG